MPDSVGFDRFTGRLLVDWDHVAQSITLLLTTRRMTRIMRRLFGSDIPGLIDAPMNDRTKIAAFVATADALEPRLVEGRQYGEPRFALVSVGVSQAAADGSITFVLEGYYVPRGHVGDGRAEDATRRLEVTL
ncbi:GPW/gp25 family protein [Xanthobacter sp. VTT E-85241]|uniref:GPW/gp25 family protein n=1 Tax=Roseixanthobacter finlandensis TaxID=3119922 RepID=UPI00372C2E59